MKNKIYLIILYLFKIFGFSIKIKRNPKQESPLVYNNIAGFKMLMNNKHIYNQNLIYDQYGKNLIRLALNINLQYPNSAIIDIGANIGDTVALIRSVLSNKIICIEGDPFYNTLCKQNIKQFNDIVLYEQFLGDVDQGLNLKPIHQNGTLKLENTSISDEKLIEIKKLDTIYLENPKLFEDVKFLKIDTDGFDNTILIGSEKLLSELKPTIFFEYSELHLSKNGINGLDIFDWLYKKDYEYLMFYEPNGRFMISCTLFQKEIITQIHNFISNYSAPLQFVDIAVFHKSDTLLFNKMVNDETVINKTGKNTKMSKNDFIYQTQ